MTAHKRIRKPLTEEQKAKHRAYNRGRKPRILTVEQREAERVRQRVAALTSEQLEKKRARDRIHRRAYCLAHPEEVRATNMAFRLAHPEDSKMRSRARYAANKEEILAQVAAWSKANPEKKRAYQASYRPTHLVESRMREAAFRLAHPEVHQAYNSAYRAAKRNAPINDFTAAQWRELQAAHDHRCAYCGKRAKGHLTQDHITPLSKGGNHTLANIIPACRSCNCHKQAGLVPSPVQPMLLTLAPARA